MIMPTLPTTTSTLTTTTSTCTIHTAYPEMVQTPLRLAEPTQLIQLTQATQPTFAEHKTSPDALDLAIIAAQQRVQKEGEQLLASAFEQAVHIGENLQILKVQEVRLQGEIDLQSRRIELLEAVLQEKWTAHIEATRVRMHAITSEISKIIKSIKTFQTAHLAETRDDRMKLLDSLGGPAFCKVIGTLSLHATYLPYIEKWLIFTDKPIGKCNEKRPQYRLITQSTPEQSGELVATTQTLTKMECVPQLAPSIQKMIVLEKQVASKKQELTTLRQLQESKEKGYPYSIENFNILVHTGTFDPCLRYANLLKEMMETYISNANARITEEKGSFCAHMKRENAGIEEANRLKGMICIIIPDIEKAVEWTTVEWTTVKGVEIDQ